MTKLRDDGYLETDDPVVSACFLGQTMGDWGELVSVGLRLWCDRMVGQDESHEYPILISASVVAEVVGFRLDTSEHITNSAFVIELFITGEVSNGIPVLWDWLSQHTGGSDE